MKPWQVNKTTTDNQSGRIEIPPTVPRDAHIDLVEGEEGSTHFRTRPGEGFTPPGGGRPTGRTNDNTPLNYQVRNIETEEYGVRDNEELYAPPAPVEPKDYQRPVMPEEFEAIWQERALKAQAAVAKSAVINTESFLQPGQGVIHERVGINAELPYANKKSVVEDEVIADLEKQIRLRREDIARAKTKLISGGQGFELRIHVLGDEMVAFRVEGGQITVMSKAAAKELAIRLLS